MQRLARERNVCGSQQSPNAVRNKSMPDLGKHRLILGGARSGKSRRAIGLAEQQGVRNCYIATAEAHDAEMAERIARHRAERRTGWTTIEAPQDLPGALATAESASAVVIDCLTLWLSNLMHAGSDIDGETARLLEALAVVVPPCIIVSNEVGLGLVPETPLGRAFRDEQGRLNQRIASEVGTVELVAAGLVLALKSTGARGRIFRRRAP
jgi:adenosylcobinamide kinase / adenosylcobinamide-phosphate guanylyltransferase